MLYQLYRICVDIVLRYRVLLTNILTVNTKLLWLYNINFNNSSNQSMMFSKNTLVFFRGVIISLNTQKGIVNIANSHQLLDISPNQHQSNHQLIVEDNAKHMPTGHMYIHVPICPWLCIVSCPCQSSQVRCPFAVSKKNIKELSGSHENTLPFVPVGSSCHTMAESHSANESSNPRHSNRFYFQQAFLSCIPASLMETLTMGIRKPQTTS